jgi:hypothetical protein
MSDAFVLLDDVQHSREFENRNYIKTPQGKKWLTISCKSKSGRKIINELEISNNNWIEEHKKTVEFNYKKSKFYSKELLDRIYDIEIDTNNFSKVIKKHILNCMNIFNIDTKILESSSFGIEDNGPIKLYKICKELDASTYISGVNGKSYIQDEFIDMDVQYHSYEHPVYEQLWGDFIPWMAFIDNLFNLGFEKTESMIKDV